MRYAVLTLLVLGLAVQYAEACGSPPPPPAEVVPPLDMSFNSVNEGNTKDPNAIGSVVTVSTSNTEYDGASDPLAEASAPEPMLDENGDYVFDAEGHQLDVYGNPMPVPDTIITTQSGGSETLETSGSVFTNTAVPASAFQALLL